MIKLKKDEFIIFPSNNNTAAPHYYQKRVKSFINTDFKHYLALGWAVPDTPYETWNYDVMQGGLTTDPAYAEPYWVSYPSGASEPSVEKADVISESISKANRKFYEKVQKPDSYNMAVSLAEAGKSIEMIVGTATQIATAYRHLRKGRIGLAMKTLRGDLQGRLTPRDVQIANLNTRRKGWSIKEHVRYLERRLPKTDYGRTRAASSTWLQIQYGWTPLLLDVYGAAQFAATKINQRSYDFRIKAGGRASRNIVIDKSDNSYWGVQLTDKQSCTLTNTRRYKIDISVTNKQLRMAAALGLTNPALVAWELVPFSFVIDWFLPVGTALQQLTARQGYTVEQGVMSDKWESSITGDYHCNSYRSWGWQRWIKTDAYFKLTHERYVRSTGAGWPSFEWPPFDILGFVSPKKILSAISLLITAFLK